MSGTVSVEQRDGVLLATISNPPHALMDVAIVDALDQLVARAAGADVKGVVLTGAHATRFIAHYEVRELLDGANAGPAVSPGAARAALRVAGLLRRVRRAEAALARTPAAGLVALERFGAILSGIEASPAVWVAALNGSAMGGGCELALACGVPPLADGLRLERAEFLSALGTAESKQAMRDYLEATERDGELPAYDPAQLARARRQGRFSSA